MSMKGKTKVLTHTHAYKYIFIITVWAGADLGIFKRGGGEGTYSDSDWGSGGMPLRKICILNCFIS